jgi:hypothetical protein
MTGLLTMTIVVTMIGLLAMRFGVDSRDGRDWHHNPGQWRPPDRSTRWAGGPGPLPRRGARASDQMVETASSRPRSVRGAA